MRPLFAKLDFNGLVFQSGGTLCRRTECVEVVLPDFKSHEQGLIGGTVGEGDHDLAAAVRGGRELLHQGRVLSDRAIDVEVTQHGGAVDGHVEDATTLGAEVRLREVKQHSMLSSGRQARNRVGEDPRPTVLIHRHGRCIGAGLGQIDGGRHDCVIPAAAEVFIRDKGVIAAAGVTLRRPPCGDRYKLPAGWRLSLRAGLS